MNTNLSKKELELFDALHIEREQDARTFNKPDYRGIWSGVVDKYKEKAHFVYELLQNADDAQATEARFQLERDRLVFRHNGAVHFTISAVNETKNKGHINAITGVGNSTKDEKKGNTIGKFGVGFKAVFQYTQEPHIYDDKFWFKIEQFIIPTALNNDFEGRKEGETLFVFPFSTPKASYVEIIERLKNLDNPILFLRHLKQVIIEIPHSEDIIYKKEIIESKKHGNITHDLISILNAGLKQKMHMFTEDVDVTDEDGKTYKQYMSVGYFLKKNGEIDDEVKGKVFCFFPTAESFHLHCVVHAPFLLVDSRQQLKEDSLNTQLKSFLAELAAEALVILRDYGKKNGQLLITENIFNLIPKKDYSYYHADNTFRDAYISVLQENKLLLGRGNKYIDCEGALICRRISMMHVINDKQLQQLRENDEESEDCNWVFLREETQKIYNQNYVKEILEELEIGEYDAKLFSTDITPEFMEKQGFSWAKRLYAHLRSEQVNTYKRPANSKKNISETPFCLSPIILTSNNTWIAPYLKSGALNVYLPLATDVDGYNFVSAEYSKDKECVRFLEDLGLKEPDTWDYIQSVILKRHQEDDELNKEELNDDVEIVYNYLAKINNATEKNNKIEILSKAFVIMSEDDSCYLAEDLYDNTIELKSFFGDRENYVCYTDYKQFIDKYSIQEFKEFIYLLGVASYPRISHFTRYTLSYEERSYYGITKYTWCQIEDIRIAGFANWNPQNIDSSKSMWIWLSDCYNLEKLREVNCSYQYYSVYHKRIFSTLYNNLFNKSWIRLSNNKLYKPSEISLEDLEAAEYKIDYNLIKFFGIERKTKSLKELGASERQIEQNELGKKAAALGLDTEEKLQEALQALKEKQERERPSSNNNKETSSNSNEQEQFSGSRDKMRKTDLDEMSSSDKDYNKKSPHVERSTEEKVNDITQKLADEANRRIEEENKRAEAESMTRYSKRWFDTLLELEYSGSSSENEGSRNGVRIVFERFRKEIGSEKIYVLSNPSRNIPIWIEELGGLTVKFTFFNRDDVSFTFEVANVKDFTLRVKAKSSDIALIDKIDWSKCTKAVIEMTSPVEIMNRLRNAFNALPFEDDYNFKDNLSDNISFVFGPPGTGKTTRLAEIIKNKMTREDCKILVLAPTNKACDVLTKKLIDISEEGYSWLGRFVATGEESIENSGVLIDRTSDLWQHNTCCIVSTIARFPYDGFTQFEESGLLKDIEWDFIIIDEASMIPLVQIVYAIYKQPLSKFIIAGDPLQIAPIVREKGWVGENIYTMVELNNFENPQTQPIQFAVEKLGTQYRSIPSIGTLYSNYCYDGKLKHMRTESQIKKLPMGAIPAKAVTFIPFRVERFDSIFGAKKLQGSNVHIYSALFAVETCAYIARQQTEQIRIGVICPYAPQAQLINKMIEQRTDIPEQVELVVGTIHGFQGDQCEIIITVFNPPTGIKVAADRIMLNNKNIINVAISRASDYLFVLLPHPDSYGYENLIEINKLCSIAKKKIHSVTVLNSDQIEKSMFSNNHYVEDNTFVTTHQLANVYTSGASLYEVRIDDNAVDIQVSSDKYQTEKKTDSNPVSLPLEEPKIVEETSKESSPSTNTPEAANINFVKSLSEAIESSRSFTSSQQYFDFFKTYSIDLPEALEILFTANTICALYILVKISGDPTVCRQLGWKQIQETDIKANKKTALKYNYSSAIYPILFQIIRELKCPIKNISTIPVEGLDYPTFKIAFTDHMTRKKEKANKKKTPKYSSEAMFSSSKGWVTAHDSWSSRTSSPRSQYQTKKEEENLYDKFEYGLSDW